MLGFIGFSELVLICIIAGIILGPDEIPKIARYFGKVIHQFRKEFSALEEELKKEVDDLKEKSEINNINDMLQEEIKSSIQNVGINDIKEDIKFTRDRNR